MRGKKRRGYLEVTVSVLCQVGEEETIASSRTVTNTSLRGTLEVVFTTFKNISTYWIAEVAQLYSRNE
jgi:hypothetical protein